MKILGMLMLMFASLAAHAQSEAPALSLSPLRPSAKDIVTLTATYQPGVPVVTRSVTVSGRTVSIRLVQDGFDFTAAWPHSTSVEFGPLSAGTYSVIVTSENPNSLPASVQTLSLMVAPLAIPLTPLALGLLVLGIVVPVALRTDRVSKPTTGDMLQ